MGHGYKTSFYREHTHAHALVPVLLLRLVAFLQLCFVTQHENASSGKYWHLVVDHVANQFVLARGHVEAATTRQPSHTNVHCLGRMTAIALYKGITVPFFDPWQAVCQL